MANNTVKNLLRCEADIAVRMVRPELAAVIARRVGEVAIRECAHQAYLRRCGIPRRPSDQLSHDLLGGDRDDETLKGFAARGYPVKQEQFACRIDDLIVVWQAVRAGLGVGSASEHLIRKDPAIAPLLPKLKSEPRPVWLAVHKEIRTRKRIRAVNDFLSGALPAAICALINDDYAHDLLVRMPIE